jgi:hypothetical protein
MKVIGYVNAKYDTGQKDANDNEIYLVKSDDVARSEINIWFKIPGISGIYFGAGGALDQTSINHFNMLADYIHGKGGIAIMHGDEGGDTDKQLISHFDVLVTAEAYVHYDGTGTLMNDFFGNPVFNNTARTWMANYPRSKFAAFSNLMAKDANGNYIYVGGSSPAELALLKRAEQDFLNYGNGYLFLLDTETGPQTNFQAEDLNYWKTFDDGLDGSFDGVLPQ